MAFYQEYKILVVPTSIILLNDVTFIDSSVFTQSNIFFVNRFMYHLIHENLNRMYLLLLYNLYVNIFILYWNGY